MREEYRSFFLDDLIESYTDGLTLAYVGTLIISETRISDILYQTNQR